MMEMLIDDFLIQVLSGLIIAAIIGAAGSFVVLIKCVHKQAKDISLMKKATSIVFRIITKEKNRLHGGEPGLSDLDEIYQDLVKDD